MLSAHWLRPGPGFDGQKAVHQHEEEIYLPSFKGGDQLVMGEKFQTQLKPLQRLNKNVRGHVLIPYGVEYSIALALAGGQKLLADSRTQCARR